ncbi:bestrophin-2-like isoform X1 [Ischnura elegans]|uniref:bestrophin-2-like isoform X1 n=1 Tax=Ischnura elegans TaxID=197161 RepID=UPI001ED89A5A|nr:bestrophin-2-like isoform X1 [Ischnura elegans]
MTITYTAEVATCSGLGNFWKLLFRWTGSIYKLLWPNLLIYSLWYFSLSLLYRFVLNESQKKTFELISLYCRAYNELIPISFVLGFYVSIVITRWWDQYLEIPWPDSLAMFVSTLLMGNDERGRLMRRTIMRYVNLSFVITLRMMCPRVKKRFPTLEHLVDAGIMQSNEKKIWEDLDNRTSHPKYWMPLVWAGSIVTRARKEGRIRDDFSMKTLIDGLCTFRGKCGGLLNYDWVCIPLVYTQVVTLAVYIFFWATLMGNQFVPKHSKTEADEVDLVVPIFTFLQFFFYMGWLKVAESLVNPFGEDDDDFEVNWLVDRNLQVSYLIVDEMHEEHPELIKDQYWDEIFPTELPYTMAAKQFYKGPPQMMFQGSTKTLEIPQDQVDFISSESAQDDDKN